MKFSGIYLELERFLDQIALPPDGKLFFPRISKVSKGLAKTYRMKRVKHYRHGLYANIYHTFKEHHLLFEDIAPVIIQWGDYQKYEQGTIWGRILGDKTSLQGSKVCDDRAVVKKEVPYKIIYAEHGWLPRWSYQLSSKGCNSNSHIKFVGGKDYVAIIGGQEVLERLKSNLRISFGEPRTCNGQLTEKPFVLVPLQTKSGNFGVSSRSATPFAAYYKRHRTNDKLGQVLIDYLESISPSSRFIFTRHPLDREHYNICSDSSILYSGKALRTIDLLRHFNCRGVIGINSNVLHEALLWNKPALPLGEMLANSSSDGPFYTDFGSFPETGQSDKGNQLFADQYMAMIFAYQWTLSDIQNPLILREIFQNVDALVPYEVRSKYGLCL
jgi:hypothetical protein